MRWRLESGAPSSIRVLCMAANAAIDTPSTNSSVPASTASVALAKPTATRR